MKMKHAGVGGRVGECRISLIRLSYEKCKSHKFYASPPLGIALLLEWAKGYVYISKHSNCVWKNINILFSYYINSPEHTILTLDK